MIKELFIFMFGEAPLKVEPLFGTIHLSVYRTNLLVARFKSPSFEYLGDINLSNRAY